MALMLSSATGTVCAQDRLYADEFPLGDVTLLEGPLKKARRLISKKQDSHLKESHTPTGTDLTDT